MRRPTLLLGQRIVLTTTSIVVVMGLLTVAVLQMIVSQTLGRELDEKGLATARILANELADPMLDADFAGVQRILDHFQRDGGSIVYAYVYDPPARRVVHTLSGTFPGQLAAAVLLPPDSSRSVHFLATERGRVRDYGVRLLDGLDQEVHVGLPEESIVASIDRVTWLIVTLTGVGVAVAAVLAWVLGRYVTRPLGRLAAAAEDIGKGQLAQDIPVAWHDEVGALADAFNRMSARLSETMDRERRRNRELTALNAVAQVVSTADDQTDVLHRAVQEIIAALGLDGGWVVLLGEDGQPSSTVAVGDIGRDLASHCTELATGTCSCWATSREVGAGRGDGERSCGVSSLVTPAKTVAGPFPLFAGGRTVGVLNVVADRAIGLNDHDFGVLQGVCRQLGLALDRARLWRSLRDREARVSQLLQTVIDAQEDERKRIARELHDETSQSMAALAVGLKAASTLVDRDPVRAAQVLENLKDAAASTVREIRNLVSDLRPTLLDDMGLVPALNWSASRRLAEHGVDVVVTSHGVNDRLPPRIETTLFRIGQEAINNAARHARARRVQIDLSIAQGIATLSIVDDGRGFNVDLATNCDHQRRQPFGLLGMAERAGLLGGTCTITSLLGEGTRVEARIPLDERPQHDREHVA
ncbi:MAG: HAMP domain-containing protein [Chloroflexi bacterium]|nr:HAMP domain-containing protein [Chloroflexota bacterium]